MTTKQSIGKVCIAPRGVYDATVEYEVLDLVTNAGGTYIAKNNVPAGTPTSNSTYWQRICTSASGTAHLRDDGILTWDAE